MTLLNEKIENLPPLLKKEVLDFAEFISRKYQTTRRTKLKFSWFGKLAEFSSSYDSLKLQKKSLDWR